MRIGRWQLKFLLKRRSVTQVTLAGFGSAWWSLSPQPLPMEERDVIRSFALLLALAQPALAQTAPTAAPKPSPTKPASAKPMPAKPAAKKPEPAKPDAAAERGPCIGVIPHIGESFEVQKIGLFSFEDKEVPIDSWGLDDLVVGRVRAAAGARFVVRRIAYPANAPKPHKSLFHDPEDDIKAIVQTIARAGECERYIVVLRSGSQFATTRYSVEGVGILNAPSITNLEGATYLFALTALYVVDGRTFDVLKQGAGSIEEDNGNLLLNGLSHKTPLHGPSRELKDFSWPPTPDAMTGLRDPTRALLAASLDVALPRLLAP
jgi:hypothetical protein